MFKRRFVYETVFFRGCYGYAIISVVRQPITRYYHITLKVLGATNLGSVKKNLKRLQWHCSVRTVTKNKLETILLITSPKT